MGDWPREEVAQWSLYRLAFVWRAAGGRPSLEAGRSVTGHIQRSKEEVMYLI